MQNYNDRYEDIAQTGNAAVPPSAAGPNLTANNPQAIINWSAVKERVFGYFTPNKTAVDVEMDKPLAEQTLGKVAETWGLDIDMIQRGSPWRRMAWYDNPDLNIRKNAFVTYDTMMLDSQVSMAVNHKKLAVISSDWEITPATDSDEDKEIAAFVQWAFLRCRGTVPGVAYEILGAIEHGYSICEMNFKVVKDGQWTGKWTLESCPAKNPLDYEFQLDPCGKIVSLYLGYRAPIPNLHLPLEKFLVYTYRPKYDRVYGRSDLQGCYWAWWFKQRVERLRGVYLERYAMPLMHGKIPASQKSLLRDLKKALKSLGGQDNLVITPDDVSIDLLSDGKQMTDAFDGTIAYYDGQIAKCILGQTLTSGEGQSSGTHALGKVHADQQEDVVTFLRNDIAEFLTERLIRTLVSLNYNVSRFPTFSWISRKDKLNISTADDLNKLISTGICVEEDANIFRARLDLPKLDKYVGSDKPLKITLPVGSGGGGVPPENVPAENNSDGGKLSFEKYARSSVKRRLSESELYACEKRVGGVEYFERTISRVEKYEADFVKELIPLIKDAASAVLIYYQKKIANPAENAATEAAIRDMAFPSKIKKAMTEVAQRNIANICYNEYDAMLREQGVKNGVPEIPKDKYAKRTDISLQTVPDAIAIKKMRGWVDNGDWKKAREWRAAQIASVAGTNETKVDFYVTGIIEQETLKETKNVIFQGMHSGQSVDAISKNIGDVFKKYGSDPKLTDPVRLEMIARTNINNAIADARLEAARDPETTDEFPALMFSALMESGTCEECAALDGSVYAVDDPIWNTITPCIHPNCNCWTIAVSADEYKESGDSKRPDTDTIAARKGV